MKGTTYETVCGLKNADAMHSLLYKTPRQRAECCWCRRGVLLAGAAFGALHNSGGRNWAFAAWAAAVGSVYGAVYLLTADIAVPAGAHSLANLAGAVLWLQFRKTSN